MYTYPEALDAMERVAGDLLDQARKRKCLPAGVKRWTVSVKADAQTGTASVTWDINPVGTMAITIYMPVMPATYRMSEAEFDSWAAYLYHEIGHPLFTNRNQWLQAVARGKGALVNALEDVREEKASNDSGIAVNGKAVLTALIDSLMVKALAGKDYDPNEPRNIGWTMSYLGRAVCNGYALDQSVVTSRLTVGGPVFNVLTWAIPALGACQSTADCERLADRIVKALPRNAPAAKPSEPGKGPSEPGKGPSEPSEPGEASSEPSESSEPGEPASGPSEPGKGPSEAGEPDSGQGEPSEPSEPGEPASGPSEPGNGQGAPSKPSEPGKGPSEPPLDHSDVKAVSLLPKEAPKQDYFTAARNAGVVDAIRKAAKQEAQKKPHQKPSPSDWQGNALAAKAAKASRQRSLLARALKANDTDDFDGGRNRGRLDSRALGRLAAGSTAVFGKRVVQEGYETDLVILVDGSSSMRGLAINVALELALVVAQAASQVGINCHAYLFNGNASQLFQITKGRDKPVPALFGGTVHEVCGTTPLCPSLLRVAFEQVARAAGKRKLLFAITDGQCDSGIQGMIGTVGYIEKSMGIEVVNLMIGMPVTKAFTNEISVLLGQSVCDVGLEQLTRQLERKALAA